MNGDIHVTTRATYQQKIKHIRQDIPRPRKASSKIPTASVVNPFTLMISSIKTVVRIPGA
jgi:hypothetical protein